MNPDDLIHDALPCLEVVMIFLLGMELNLQNVVYFSRGALNSDRGTWGLANVRRAYKKVLQDLQPAVPQVNDDAPALIKNPKDVTALIEIFNQDNALNDVSHVIEPSQKNDKFAERNFHDLQSATRSNKNVGDIFRLVIHGVFYAPSAYAGGGTTSAAIGVLWLDPRDSWVQQDFYEAAVHELSHTLMFIDEFRYCHYHDMQAVIAPKNFFKSAILAKQRPLDKVIHSLVVSTEVLLHRIRQTGHPTTPRVHPPTAAMLKRAIVAASELKKSDLLKDLATNRVLDLVAMCYESLQHIEAKTIAA